MAITLSTDIDPDRPWLWKFDLPFPEPLPASEHPHYSTICDQTMHWLRTKGIVENNSHIEQQRRHDLPSWPILCYPTASVESLRLISDWTSWWGFWDDMLATPEHRDRGSDLFTSMLHVMDGKAPAMTDPGYRPFIDGWSDIWRRWGQGMPDHWIRRTEQNWRESLMEFINEYRFIRDGHEFDAAGIQASRDLTGLNYPILDMIERAGGFALPTGIAECETMRSMKFHANREIWLTQELQSCKKEEADGEPNLVFVFERVEGSSRIEACQQIHCIIRNHTDEFLKLEAGVPAMLDGMGIEPQERIPVYKYISGMRSVMAGTAAFVARSGRYSSDE